MYGAHPRSEQRADVDAVRIWAAHLWPLHEELIGNRVDRGSGGGLGVDSAEREHKDDLAAQKLADVTKRNGRVAACSDDGVRSEPQNNRHRKKPIDDEVPPKHPISISPVGAYESARPPLQQLARERQILGHEVVLGRRKQLFQLEDLGKMTPAGAW